MIKTKVESGIPTQTQKQEFRDNRNVTVLELNDQVTAVECKNTIFKHGGVIKNPRQIAVKISDIINVGELGPNLYLEPWGISINQTGKIKNELGEIEQGFLDRSSESINKPWWEFWNLSETNKHKILMSSLFALILLCLGTVLSTKCGRKLVFKLLKSIYRKLCGKCCIKGKIEDGPEEIKVGKLETIKEENDTKPRKLSIVM